jgi:hypothetical protein
VSEPRPPAATPPDERDAWLSQALRHAPDVAAAPPNALREAILAEARSAVRPLGRSSMAATQATLADRLAAFWAWLARPPVAAGFAGVMAATLVGLMWWDRPMDESLTPPPVRIAKPDAAAPPAAPSVAPDALASPSPAAAPPTAAAPALPKATTTPTRRQSAPSTQTAAAGVSEEKQRKDSAPSNALQAAPSTSPFPGNDRNRGESGAQNEAVGRPELAKKAEGEAATAASVARLPAEPSGDAATAGAPRLADAATADAKSTGTGATAKASSLQRQGTAAPPRDASDALASRAAAAPQAFAAAPAPVAAPATARQAAAKNAGAASTDTSTRPMASLLGSLSLHPERWSRPVTSGEALPLDAQAQAWLASVDTATAGRWQARSAHAIRLDDEESAGDASSLPLNLDGRSAAIVRVDDGGVTFELAPGPAWFAPLPGEAVARLRASLPPARR